MLLVHNLTHCVHAVPQAPQRGDRSLDCLKSVGLTAVAVKHASNAGQSRGALSQLLLLVLEG